MWTLLIPILKSCGGVLLKYWREVIIVIFIGLFSYQMFSPDEFLFGLKTVKSEHSKYEKAETNVVTLQSQVKTIEKDNNTLSIALTDQNAKIKDWGDISKKIDDTTQQLIVVITKSQVQSKIDISTILNKPTPVDCEKSVDFIRDEIKSGGISWKK